MSLPNNRLFDIGSIIEISSDVTAQAGENAEFFCAADGNPINEDTIKWTRSEFDMDRTVSTFFNETKTTYLVVQNVTADDSGEFFCEVSNAIGETYKNSTFLLVRGEQITNTFCTQACIISMHIVLLST